jgi:hypothetical protein
MALPVTPYTTGFTYEYQTLHEYNEGLTMAPTDGSTTKAKGKKAKSPKAKVKKNGNGSKTVTLEFDEGTTEVQAEETVSKAQFAALQKQMADLLTKFGPVLKAAEAGAKPAAVEAAEQMKMGMEAFATSEAAEPSSTEIVPPKPKKKYTKKPKALPVAEPTATDFPAAVAAGPPQAGEFGVPFVIDLKGTPVEPMVPQKPGPQMDTAALMKKLSETPPPSLIEKYEKVEHVPATLSIKGQKAKVISVEPTQVEVHVDLAKDDTVSKAVEQTVVFNPKGEGTGGDLVVNPDGSIPTVPPLGELPKLVEKPPVQAKTTATVTKQFGKDSSKQEVTEETLAVHTFITQPAVIGVEAGLTMNLGNYESARISVSISVPCYAEERDAAYNEACKWVEERISKQRDAIITSKNATGF